ncbi:LacI family transcriptional regulator [Marinithermofilum abyssi]|uniref:LacI family transcriptional regulator n=1 Tax=Marinithermofilum abyssi TaxID=1571185 RepID=A0A8J2VFS7_9BACL|nr:LacI family DNA-binding transcriptional regulator [Marinithermofilum abyssi]GGE03933.1 LacI family transcriptional regulator [Marinithermofilum abyssi]
MATIKDVAERAGVSISTVSLALNNQPHVRPETRRRVLKAAKQLNYRPNGIARDLKSSKTETIGLILSDLAGPFYSELIRGIQDVTAAYGYDLVVVSAIGDSPKSARYIQEKRTDGMVVLAHSIPSDLILEAARPEFPIVVLDRELKSDHVYSVVVDNRKAAFDATMYLLDKGYRQVAYLGGPSDSADNAKRFDGFREAIMSRQLTVEPKWLLQGNFTKEGGHRAVRLLAAQGLLPEAIFSANDEMAIGAMEALAELGVKVPEEVAVVGFDDIQLARYVRPGLTTVHQPMYDMGTIAANLLFRRLQGDDSVRSVVMETKLVVRESCGAKSRPGTGSA